MGQSTSQKLSENTGETLNKHPASALTHYLEVLFIIVVTAYNYLDVIKTLTRKRFVRGTLESGCGSSLLLTTIYRLDLRLHRK